MNSKIKRILKEAKTTTYGRRAKAGQEIKNSHKHRPKRGHCGLSSLSKRLTETQLVNRNKKVIKRKALRLKAESAHYSIPKLGGLK